MNIYAFVESNRIGYAAGGAADVGGLERTDVDTKLIELALHGLESALSGRGEISAGHETLKEGICATARNATPWPGGLAFGVLC